MTFRPDPAAQTGTYDTTDTAGPSARFGKIEDTAAVFDIARAATGLPADVPHEPADPAG
jgi:hypothetical protein